MKYYIIAGEASGDLHGSNLMKGLYAEDPKADIRFWGGDLMTTVWALNQSGGGSVDQNRATPLAAGIGEWSRNSPVDCFNEPARDKVVGGVVLGGTAATGLVRHYKEGAVMGFVEVVAKAGRLLKNVDFCKKDILAWSPDVVILIDYPGFNFKIAEFAHKAGFKVFYYIAPKVWASREGRIKKLRKYVDKLFIVFPFEKEYFDSKGIEYIYKGNPLIDAVDNSKAMSQSKEEFFAETGLDNKPFIAMLAGSRKGYSPWLDEENSKYIKVLFGQTQSIIRHAEAAVVNSGTASLETALFCTPQVVGYISNPVTYWIAKRIVKIQYISLGNLIINRLAFKEFIQNDCNADALVTEIRDLIENKDRRERMLDSYGDIRAALGGTGASSAVAKAMIENL